MNQISFGTQIVFLCVDKYQSDGIPFFLAEVFGKTVIQCWIEKAEKLSPDCQMHFVVESQSHVQIIEAILNKLSISENYFFHIIPRSVCGSAASALFIVSQLPSEADLFIVSTNELINLDLNQLRNRLRLTKPDAGILLFKSFQPKYSYVQLEDGAVIGVFQYKVVSEYATTGLFYFSSCKKFVEYASKMILKGEAINNKFYVAVTLNEAILEGGVIGYELIDARDYMPLKSDKDMFFALSSSK